MTHATLIIPDAGGQGVKRGEYSTRVIRNISPRLVKPFSHGFCSSRKVVVAKSYGCASEFRDCSLHQALGYNALLDRDASVTQGGFEFMKFESVGAKADNVDAARHQHVRQFD